VSGETYWVYILECENGSYYTGYTTDLTRRFQEHLQGTAKCKYTRAFKPIKIAQSWQITGSKADAMKVEREIKKLSRAQKIKLIKEAQAANSPDLYALNILHCLSSSAIRNS
jgi:putative endonuclease